MLRVKQDKILELEENGFKKKFDVDTGEIDKFTFDIEEKIGYFTMSNKIIVDAKTGKISVYTEAFHSTVINPTLYKLYNLIKLDIIENMEEDNE